jgi:mRNA interferase RelE/StbE
VSYDLALKGTAQREFQHLPSRVREQVAHQLEALQLEPRPVGCLPLSGELRGQHRVRVGDYRIVYIIDEAAQRVGVTRIRHRSQVCK